MTKHKHNLVCQDCGHKRLVLRSCPICRRNASKKRFSKPKRAIMSPKRALIGDLNRLWAEAVKARAGYKSEFSGRKAKGRNYLNAHHILGKSTQGLRWSLDNGYCLLASEHVWGIHMASKESEYRDKIKEQRGSDIYERLKMLKQVKKIDLAVKKQELEAELKKYGCVTQLDVWNRKVSAQDEESNSETEI